MRNCATERSGFATSRLFRASNQLRALGRAEGDVGFGVQGDLVVVEFQGEGGVVGSLVAAEFNHAGVVVWPGK